MRRRVSCDTEVEVEYQKPSEQDDLLVRRAEMESARKAAIAAFDAYKPGRLADVKAKIAEYEKLLPVAKSISFRDAEWRAGQFLEIQALITNWRHLFSEEKIRLLSVQTAVYAAELGKGQAKTMTENKVTAEASANYTKAREDLERIENDLSFLKTYYDIFTNAHVFYRQMAKGENA